MNAKKHLVWVTKFPELGHFAPAASCRPNMQAQVGLNYQAT